MEWFVVDATGLTSSWHDGGALVLRAVDAADAEQRAKEWAQQLRPSHVDTPFQIDSIRPLEDEDFNIFPDAGCC